MFRDLNSINLKYLVVFERRLLLICKSEMNMIELILGAAIGVGGMIVKDQFLGNKQSEEYAKAQREINTLSDEVERLKKRNRECETRIEELISENKNLSRKNKERDLSYDDIEDERDVLKSKVKALQLSNDELSRKLQEYKNACESLQNEINTLKGRR